MRYCTGYWLHIPEVESFVFYWQQAGAEAWDSLLLSRNFVLLNNLEPGGVYAYYVENRCAAGSFAQSDVQQFQTGLSSDACAVPAITRLAPEARLADLEWMATTGADRYELAWKPWRGGEWSVVSLEDRAYSIAGLEPSRTYRARVRAICSSGHSKWEEERFSTNAEKQVAFEAPEAQLTVYPNPSDGVYTLAYDLQAEGAEIVVRNVVGATVWRGAAEGRQGQTTIDLSSAAAGVYVCNVFSGGALVRSVKLVKR